MNKYNLFRALLSYKATRMTSRVAGVKGEFSAELSR